MIEVKLKILLLFFVILLIPFFVSSSISCRGTPDGWYCSGVWLYWCESELSHYLTDCSEIECSGTCPNSLVSTNGFCQSYGPGDAECRYQIENVDIEDNEAGCTGCCYYGYNAGVGDCTAADCLTKCCGNDLGENYWMNIFCDDIYSCFNVPADIACCNTRFDAVDQGNCYLACDAPGGDCLEDASLLSKIQLTGYFPSWDRISNGQLWLPSGIPSGIGSIWLSCDVGEPECEDYCGGLWVIDHCVFGGIDIFCVDDLEGDCCTLFETCPSDDWISGSTDCPARCCNQDCITWSVEECGNDEIEGEEECDDGNTVTEECDYGKTSCIVCDEDCAKVAGETDYCGDGNIDVDYEVCESDDDCDVGFSCIGCTDCLLTVLPCNIIDAYWSDTDGGAYSGSNVAVIEGETAYLIVNGEAGCEGRMVTFDYVDNDLSYPLDSPLGLFNDPISGYNLPTSLPFPAGGTQISHGFITIWMADAASDDLDGIPEVEFTAHAPDNDADSENQLLITEDITEPGCVITDYYWTNKSDGTKFGNDNIRVDHGTEVYLVVDGLNCEGESGTLQYWDYDSIVQQQIISDPSDYGLPISFSFGASENRVIETYTTQWYYADGGIHSGPEYVFKVTIDGVQTDDYSNELIVDKLGDCSDVGLCCDVAECNGPKPGYECSSGVCCTSCGSGGCAGELCMGNEQCGETNSSWEIDVGCEHHCDVALAWRCWSDLGDGNAERRIASSCVDDEDGDNIGTYNIVHEEFELSNPTVVTYTWTEEKLPCFLDQDIPFFDSLGIVFVLSILVGFYLYKKKKI